MAFHFYVEFKGEVTVYHPKDMTMILNVLGRNSTRMEDHEVSIDSEKQVVQVEGVCEKGYNDEQFKEAMAELNKQEGVWTNIRYKEIWLSTGSTRGLLYLKG